MHKPRIGIGLGDRNGIEQADITVVGHPAVLEFGRVTAHVDYAFGFSVVEHTAFANQPIATGKVNARAGAEALDQIAILLDGARRDEIDAIVVAPVNEDALRLGGLKEDDEVGQVALRLVKFGDGITVIGGLPFPVTTVGQGTAYDIAGKGIARAGALLEAFRVCCKLANAKVVVQT